MIKTLRYKFIMINMSLVSIILFTAFISLYTFSSMDSKMKSTEFLNVLINENNLDEEPHPKPNPRDDKPRHLEDDRKIFAFTLLLDKDYNLISIINTRGEVSADVIEGARTSISDSSKETGVISSLELRYLMRETNRGYKIAFTDISSDNAFLLQLTKTSIIVGIGAFSAFFLISIFLSRYALRPVEKAWSKQQQFISDASHELKTPITVILATTSILLNSKNKEQEDKDYKWITYIDSEAKRMQGLVEDLLFLAKTDEAQNSIVRTAINLNDTVQNCLLIFEPMAFEAGLKLDSSLEGKNLVLGDAGMLKQLIMILLDNAIKYSRPNSIISLELLNTGSHALLKITNHGDPIPAEDIPHIFDRFYKGDKSRNRKNKSYGLGLSIASEIVSSHKGKISVESSLEKGTTFFIQIPLTRKS